ncbi:MAG: hypothetical protein K8U57_35635 [Planctomycetes bacterium]|nr:hypothetical protein [Planctomycetota bacterium]
MLTQIMRVVYVVCVVCAHGTGVRADEATAVKVVEDAGGKLTFWKNSNPRMITLDLSGCARADEVLGKIDTLAESVVYLHLGKSALTDAGLKLLANSPRLKELDVSGTAITNAGLPLLKELAKLSELDLRNTKVTADGLKGLDGLAALHNLKVSGAAVTDEGVKHIASLNVGLLILADSTALTDAGIAHLYRTKGRLSGVDFSNCQVSPEAIKGFDGGHLFGIGYTNQKVTPEHIAAIKGIKRLRAINLSGTGYSFSGAEGFEEIVSLTFRDNKVTPECAKAIGAMPKMQTLYLDGCDLGDDALPHLAGLKGLKVLHLSGTKTKVTDKGLSVLNDSKNISFLYLRKTAITGEGARELKRHLDQTHIITD